MRNLLLGVVLVSFLLVIPALGIEPNEILIIANSDFQPSVRIAEYYCEKRAVPTQNILSLPLGVLPADSISRSDYHTKLAAPVRKTLSTPKFSRRIRCLLTTYGVPFKVGGRGIIRGQEENLRGLRKLSDEETRRLRAVIMQLKLLAPAESLPNAGTVVEQMSLKPLLNEAGTESTAALKRIKSLKSNLERTQLYEKWLQCYEELYGKPKALQAAKNSSDLTFLLTLGEQLKLIEDAKLVKQAAREKWGVGQRIKAGHYDSLIKVVGLLECLEQLNADIDRIEGRETEAAVDSELSMILFDDYELYRWQPNELKDNFLRLDVKTLMVSRLDGPSERIARSLIDKAVRAEKIGLKGMAYIDSRGLEDKEGLYSPGYFDKSLQDTAALIRALTKIPVVEENTPALFGPGQCPHTALYCGWYGLQKYVDAFGFVEGAVGFHIASWEAVNLRDPESTQWCPAMLTNGITATIGAVAEPYLHTFPEPRVFFAGLVNGRQLVEAYYQSLPVNSWQFVLIGDPLYRPFKK